MSAVYNSAVMAHKTWTSTIGCPGNDRLICNSDYFVDFTEIIKTTEWKRNDIAITVGNLRNHQFYDFEYQ